MKKLLFLAIVTYLMVACTGNHASSQREPQSGDTLYTAEAAMVFETAMSLHVNTTCGSGHYTF